MSWKVELTFTKEFPTLAKAEKGMKPLINKGDSKDWMNKLNLKHKKEE